MCSRCYRLVTATTKATSRASIATAVSTGTSFLSATGGPPSERRRLLNDRPGRLTEPDRVFDSSGLMLGDELDRAAVASCPIRLISAGRCAVSSTQRRRQLVVVVSEKEALGACPGLAAWSATARSAR
jgi:hypothetical protein